MKLGFSLTDSVTVLQRANDGSVVAVSVGKIVNIQLKTRNDGVDYAVYTVESSNDDDVGMLQGVGYWAFEITNQHEQYVIVP